MTAKPKPRSVVSHALISDAERTALIREHGEALAHHMDEALERRAHELTIKNAEVLAKALMQGAPPDLAKPLLLSHGDAAFALGISESTVKKLVQDGRLPKPVKISEHRIGHRWEDLKAFADGLPNPIKLTPPSKPT